MALRSLTGPIHYPTPTPHGEGQATTAVSHLLDASGQMFAIGLYAPKAGILHKVGVRLGTVTTGQPLRVSFQDPDLTTGDPDGVPDQFRDVAVADTDDNAWKLTGILSSDGTDNGTKRTVAKGERLYVVIGFAGGVGNLNLTSVNSGSLNRFSQSCFGVHFTSSWAKVTNGYPTLYLEYSDGSTAVIPGAWPYSTFNALVLNEASNPDEVGIRFTVPWRCEADGMWAHFSLQNINSGATLKLYDSAGTLLRSVVLAPMFSEEISNTATGEWAFSDGAITLEPNVIYYATIRANGTTSLSLRWVGVDAANIMDAWDGGSAVRWVQRQNDSGVFEETTTRRPMMGLRISALEDGVNPVTPVYQVGSSFKALVREVWP